MMCCNITVHLACESIGILSSGICWTPSRVICSLGSIWKEQLMGFGTLLKTCVIYDQSKLSSVIIVICPCLMPGNRLSEIVRLLSMP